MTHTAPHSPPEWDYPTYQPGEPVALFIPCYIDQFFPRIAEATARLLTRFGVPGSRRSTRATGKRPAG